MSNPIMPDPVVSVDWLLAHLDDPEIRIIDATYFPPNMPGTARDVFDRHHIRGAAFFDIDAIADQESYLPHMLPPPAFFAEAVQALGIENHHHIICYDTHGMMTAARAWWMFRYFGHDRVSVLDGGFPAWQRISGPVRNGPPSITPAPRIFQVAPRPNLVIDRLGLSAALNNPDFVLLDARTPGRFDGTEPEIWPGRRAGHIAGARNLPFGTLLDPDTKTMRPPDILKGIIAQVVSLDTPALAANCGSGVTACMLALGFAQCGRDDVRIYDGSWAEWGWDKP